MTPRAFSLPGLFGAFSFTALGFLAVSAELAPVGLDADALPSPDLLFCLTAYCSPRWPKAVSILPVFLLGLARDLLTDTPVGVGALTLVLVMVLLSQYRSLFTNRPFWSEWLCCIPVFAAVLVVQWFFMLITLARLPVFLDLFWLLIVTVAAYGPVALLLRVVFRIGKAGDTPRIKGAP